MTRARSAPVAAPIRFYLIGCVGLTGAGLVLRLPPTITTVALLLLAWQVIAARRDWPLPGVLLRSTLTAVGFALVFASVGDVTGKQAGSALLWLMLALKLCELRTHRDVMLVLTLSCFLLVSEFLFSQAPWMVAYFLAGLAVITTGFVYVNQGPETTRLAPAAREAAGLVLFALPIMVLLFVVFPRIPGSLWGTSGGNQSIARTGLSNHMSPGAISRLVRSDGVAFRVRMTRGAMPAPAKRYWRGPVLWRFNDGTWRTTRHPQYMATSNARRASTPNNVIQTRITLAPTARHWLIALDRPIAASHDSRLTVGGSLRADHGVYKRIVYTATSTLGRVPHGPLPAAVRERALQLPATGNRRSRRLARRWARHSRSARAIINKALALFHDNAFYYTLKPPATGRANSIDDFLFDTRRGFCAHYASAFTFLMRAAGLPARVVTGYQGATHASVGNYWIVRNADAHAWSQVWIAGRGWVRVDPTAAVAPGRIEHGVDAAVVDPADLPFMVRTGRGWLYHTGMAWDAVEAGWNQFVLGYGPTIQKRAMSALGLTSLRRLLIGLSLAVAIILGVISLILAWQMRQPRERDRVVAQWHRLRRQLSRRGIAHRNSEGPQAFADRVARTRPELGDSVGALADDYIRIRYAGHDTRELRRQFLRRARRFRWRRRL